MRLILLLTIVLLSSCENKKETITKRQQAINEKMGEVKTAYFKKVDSLDRIKEADTSSAKQFEIAEELVSAGEKKSVALIKLQKEYDSLDAELKKY